MRCIDTIQLKIKTAPEEFTSGANEKKEFNWIPEKKCIELTLNTGRNCKLQRTAF